MGRSSIHSELDSEPVDTIGVCACFCMFLLVCVRLDEAVGHVLAISVGHQVEFQDENHT